MLAKITSSNIPQNGASLKSNIPGVILVVLLSLAHALKYIQKLQNLENLNNKMLELINMSYCNDCVLSEICLKVFICS